MKEQFLAWFKDLTLREQADIIGHCKDIRSDKFYSTYRIVNIYNGHCNISHIIQKETGFECYHEPGDNSSTIGTNKIMIPIELYTRELELELIAKWENWRKQVQGSKK